MLGGTTTPACNSDRGEGAGYQLGCQLQGAMVDPHTHLENTAAFNRNRKKTVPTWWTLLVPSSM